MNRKYLVMAVAAIFTMAIIGACSNKDKNNQESADVEDTEELDDEEEDEDLDEKQEYLSQDLATFDLYGQVQYAVYHNSNDENTVKVSFDPKGQVVDIVRVDEEQKPEKASIITVDKKRIDFIAFESDDPWMTSFDYDETASGFVAPRMSMETNQMGNNDAYTYHRDKDGKLKKVEHEEVVHGNVVEDESTCSVKVGDYDRHNNWQSCTFSRDEYKYTYTRTIKYYRSDDMEEAADKTKQEQTIKNFVTDMYEKQRYEDYDFLREHCTRKMLEKLSEEYEYDGEGYAIWLFRTSSQDGKPGSEGMKNKVTSFSKDQNNGGDWFVYKFLDGGWRGENRIKVFIYEGKCWIDGVERISDEAAAAYAE